MAFDPVHVLVLAFVHGDAQCSPLEGADPISEESAVQVNLHAFITLSKFGDFGLNLQQFSTDLISALFG